MCNQTNISTVTIRNIFKIEFRDAITNFISYLKSLLCRIGVN